MKRHQGNMGTGIQVDQVDVPPGAVRRVEADDRQRAAGRALPAGPLPRTPQITEKLAGLRAQIAQFRTRAVDLHAKLVELESKGDDQKDVRALRDAMMAHVVRIEAIVRAVVDTPDPTQPARFPSGTRVKR